MRNFEPCPSPNGTNLERLYLVRMPYRGPQMAMDAEMDTGMTDPQADINASDDDMADKIHQLLDGKLEPGDIEELIRLVMGDPQDGPIAQPPDTSIASDAKMRRRLAEGPQARAKLGMDQRSDLLKRFPSLANARVV